MNRDLNKKAQLKFHVQGIPALHLQERDVYMLELLHKHPLLTSAQLDALVINRFSQVSSPNGKTVWPTHPGGLKRRRIKMMQHNLIAIPASSHKLGGDRFFYLTHKGYRILREALDKDLYWAKNTYKDVAFGSLFHFNMINQLFTCLELALSEVGGLITRWYQDGRIYEAVTTPPYSDAEQDETKLTPDAFAIIQRPDETGQALYIEADRSGGVRLKSKSRPARTMLARYRRYWHFQKSSGKPFVVLTVTSNKTRMENMKNLLQSHDPWADNPTSMFWFKAQDYDLEKPHAALTNWLSAWNQEKNLLHG